MLDCFFIKQKPGSFARLGHTTCRVFPADCEDLILDCLRISASCTSRCNPSIWAISHSGSITSVRFGI